MAPPPPQASALRQPEEFDLEASDQANEWRMWRDCYEIYEIACGVDKKENKIRRATLLHCLGSSVQRIFQALPGEKGTYEQTLAVLAAYFTPKKNVVAERYRFRKRKQEFNETIDQYATALRDLAKSCAFRDIEEEMIRDQIVEKCASNTLREKLLAQDELTLDKVLKMARTYETVRQEAKAMAQGPSINPEVDTFRVGTRGRKSYNNNKRATQKPAPSGYDSGNQYSAGGKSCYRCGKSDHMADKCGAISATCSYCKKVGHLQRVCRKKISDGQKNSASNKKGDRRKLRAVLHAESDSDSSDSSSFTYRIHEKSRKDSKESILLNGQRIKCVPDTGSEHTIISAELYHKLFRQFLLHKTKKQFLAYGQKTPLTCRGFFKARITWNRCITQEDVYIIDGHCNAETLLGKTACYNLGIFTKPGYVHKVGTHLQNSEEQALEELLNSYEDVFVGPGCITNYEHKVTVDSTVPPVAQKLRRKPYAMAEAINQELDKLLEDDVIEPVNEGTEWVSNIVTVPKKDSNEIRVCIDLREVNKAVVRERHPTRTVEDILHSANGSRYFARLDALKGFHQCILAPESRNLTTFITTRGCYRFKRVPFGLASASEAFQKAIDNIFQGLDGVEIHVDDLLIHARTFDELLSRIRAVLERCRERNLKLNMKKSKFSMSSLDILGHVIDADGIHADPAKVQAIVDAKPPRNLSELRSFLGMATYVSKFIPNFATMSEPLRKMTRKNIKWNWNSDSDKAFRALKEALMNEHCLAFYNLDRETFLVVDASPFGLGGILMQTQPDGTRKPVSFASRSLNDTERRYSQIEREALACVWAVEHFHLYLWGKRFILQTDHKPLIHMLDPKVTTVLPARIDRLSWRLRPYDFEIQHIKGTKNIADFLSRSPSPNCTDNENIAEDYIRSIVLLCTSEEMEALSFEDIQEATLADKVLQKVIAILKKGEWPKKIPENLKPFHRLRDELSLYENCILRGERIVIPKALQQRVLSLAHETHQGIVRTKQMLRLKFYWPNMDDAVEHLVSDCEACVLNQSLLNPAPLHPTELPPGPWYKLAMDIVGPIKGKFIFTMIDYYSSFPEAFVLKDITSAALIARLRDVFARFGYPKCVVTDNGGQFVSEEFEAFLIECGISHYRSSPYYPKSNGKIERFHRYLKKAFRAGHATGKTWVKLLPKILMAYRNTPHRATGKTPAQLLLNREMRDKLPTIPKEGDVDTSGSFQKERYDRYQKKMKEYHDKRRHATEHAFQIGDVVYTANVVKQDKLTSQYSKVKHVIIGLKSTNTFKLVNTETGKRLIRNSQYLRLCPVVDVDEELQVSGDLQRNPAGQVDEHQLATNRRPGYGRAVRLPERYKDFDMSL